ncbi:MAG: response regulator [Chloroflexota bacterium]
MITHQSCILVVDDNESVRDILSILLKGRGHRVVIAKHGQEALDVMRRESIDLVLLDIMMPVMDGYDVLRWMRADPELSSKPVVVLTAIHDTDSIIKCIEMGADDYLFKPINRAVLMARVDASVEKKRLRDVEHNHIMELAILQQIDRELNASLDLKEVARITLGWAMRQTDAQAGLIGIVEDGHVDILQREHLPFAEEEVVPLDLLVDGGETNGRLQTIHLSASQGSLPALQHRLIVPIQREDVIDCLMLLDKAEGPDKNSLNFLSRLRDHAAIALVNARLHAAVQEANQAKSDFISLVSHELKTPIAIVRNYAELIISGRSGDISPKQQRFTETIRTNVLRMKALVSDLDDISPKQKGPKAADL